MIFGITQNRLVRKLKYLYPTQKHKNMLIKNKNKIINNCYRNQF